MFGEEEKGEQAKEKKRKALVIIAAAVVGKTLHRRGRREQRRCHRLKHQQQHTMDRVSLSPWGIVLPILLAYSSGSRSPYHGAAGYTGYEQA